MNTFQYLLIPKLINFTFILNDVHRCGILEKGKIIVLNRNLTEHSLHVIRNKFRPGLSRAAPRNNARLNEATGRLRGATAVRYATTYQSYIREFIAHRNETNPVWLSRNSLRLRVEPASVNLTFQFLSPKILTDRKILSIWFRDHYAKR